MYDMTLDMVIQEEQEGNVILRTTDYGEVSIKYALRKISGKKVHICIFHLPDCPWRKTISGILNLVL